jgi:hypothetical protein
MNISALKGHQITPTAPFLTTTPTDIKRHPPLLHPQDGGEGRGEEALSYQQVTKIHPTKII